MTSPLIVAFSAPEAASALGSAAHNEPERPTNKLLAAKRERIDFVESFMTVSDLVLTNLVYFTDKPVERAEDCLNRRQFDIRVDSHAPLCNAGNRLDLNVGNRPGIRTRTQGMLAIIADFELRRIRSLQGIDKGRNGTVTVTDQVDPLRTPKDRRLTA